MLPLELGYEGCQHLNTFTCPAQGWQKPLLDCLGEVVFVFLIKNHLFWGVLLWFLLYTALVLGEFSSTSTGSTVQHQNTKYGITTSRNIPTSCTLLRTPSSL